MPVFLSLDCGNRYLKQIRKRRYKHLFFLCLVCSLSFRAYADVFAVTPALRYFQYQEFDQDNRLLSEEKGVLPGLKLGFDHPVGNGIVESHIAFFESEIDYNGQTQSGEPHETDTGTRLTSLGLKWLSVNQARISGRLFLGYRYWNWDRDIQANNGVLGLHEVYTWHEFELGLRFESEKNQHHSYWLDLSAMYVINPNVEISLPSSKVNLSLGNEPGFRIRAGKEWTRNERQKLSFTLFAEYWEFGRSDTVFTDDFFGQSAFLVEPRSESFHTGLELSFKFFF